MQYNWHWPSTLLLARSINRFKPIAQDVGFGPQRRQVQAVLHEVGQRAIEGTFKQLLIEAARDQLRLTIVVVLEAGHRNAPGQHLLRLVDHERA